MTTKEPNKNQDLELLNHNLERVEVLSKRLVTAFSHKKSADPALTGPGNELFSKAGTALMTEMVNNPAKIIEQQAEYWGKTMRHYAAMQQEMMSGSLKAPEDDTEPDRRFQNPLWQTNPYFNFVKQQYLHTAQAISESVKGLEGLNSGEKKRAEYFSQQIVDLYSPANFLGTNPDALARAVETEGQSLVDGLENLVRDVEANDGELLVNLVDKDAFSVGDNLATSEGSVVYRNRMFELIQYAPKGETVHKIPLVLFPPWINKFYILDLKPGNSLIKWVVEQGYTMFVVSWINPDPSYRDVGLDTYIEEGILRAIDEVKQITGEPQVNAVGYCIAGATLAMTLALMKKRGDKSVKSATFFTTLTDFADNGEIGVFLSDDFVDGIEREVADKGIMASTILSRTFSYMRSNDLIYGPAIRSYMMGQAPPAFDLLYWNGDSTNLPARMAVEYLRWLCQENRFAKGTIKICGETVSIKDVNVPVCAVACETDHIVGWKASFEGVKQFGSRNKTFILSESGHIAGIVNPPSKKKYGHYTNDVAAKDADTWLSAADFHKGSWWPRWGEWLAKQSGKKIAAPTTLGNKEHPVICAAPGEYVTANPNQKSKAS